LRLYYAQYCPLQGGRRFHKTALSKSSCLRAQVKKQLRAFNMCDGAKGQAEIAKALKIDRGNFSRTVSRWIDEGIVFRLGEGRDAKLLHVYALPEGVTKTRGRRK
jgi:hypothetical protein